MFISNFRLSKFQDLIAEQFDIAACEQLLVFEDDLFTNVVESLTPIRNYPTSISVTNPVLVFMKHYFDQKKFPIPVVCKYIGYYTTYTLFNRHYNTSVRIGSNLVLENYFCEKFVSSLAEWFMRL